MVVLVVVVGLEGFAAVHPQGCLQRPVDATKFASVQQTPAAYHSVDQVAVSQHARVLSVRARARLNAVLHVLWWCAYACNMVVAF